ncbi:MAG: hypothetical protein M1469_00970 [Bacteroidetes bacterium]|nr:hypothetical protein [Bacteroidota bacterium]MCL5266660.1 hypothetical protein [Bacteroidota bacterium]
MVRRICLAVLLVSALVSTAFSQWITAKAFTDKTEYQVGDYIHYSIQVDCNKGTAVHPPFITDSVKSVSIIQTEKPVMVEKNGKATITYNFILAGYDSAGVTIPSIPVFYQILGKKAPDSVVTNAVSFTVSTLKVNLQGNIKDVKRPLKIPLNWLWIALWVFLALLIAGLIFYLYRRHKLGATGTKPVSKVPALPPDAVALNALQELEKKQLWQNGQIKEYHSAITEIIRRYFEGRFSMPAMELPTSEAVDLLRKQRGSEPVVETTYNFLSNADLVKFAKYTPLGPVNEEMMQQAYQIVNKSRQNRDTEEEKQAATSDVQ